MLNDNVVAVTGGLGLIGKAFCKEIIKNDGKVIIGDLFINQGISFQNELGAENALFLELNSSDSDSIDNFLENSKNHFGKIDSAVHCAYPRSKQWGTEFEKLKAEGLRDDLFNQLGGAIIFSQRLISFYRAQGYGNLIHISSIQGLAAPKFEHYEGTKMVSPIEYSAIKSGIISITKYLAKYCKGENIRVNSISPGGILDNQPEVFLEKYNSSCISKGMMEPQDLNGTLIYLLSSMSKFVNGQNIIVDDGWTL
ncbi:oxidoreductase [Candidatus Thioglobus sp.]|nr:oxidoreductase [Candidatus Thioglobus sp.]